MSNLHEFANSSDTPNIPNPHDSLFKATFSQVQYAADEFRHVLPAALVARLDFTTLAMRSGSFIDGSLRGRSTDLLYAINLDGHKAFLYLLFEHQSTVDHLMAFRLSRYLGNIWSWYLNDHPQSRRLPAIISIVLHHSGSGGGWTAPTSLRDLIDLDGETRIELGDLLPSLTFIIDDLSVQEDQALRDRVMHAIPKLTFWALKHARNSEALLDTLAAWSDVVREVLRSPTGLEAFSRIMQYIMSVTKIDPDRLRNALSTQIDEQTEEAFMTGVEILLQRGRDEVRQQQRDILLMQLQERFGELPDAVTEQVRSAQPEQLVLWARRVISAPSLDALFAQPQP